MATGDITTKYGAATALTITLNSLGAGSFATSSAVTISGATGPVTDMLVEVLIADITETGNKQVIVYAVSTVDGTNFGDNTRQSAMFRIGTLDLTGTGPFRSQAFSVAAAFRVLPPQVKIVVMNDAGASLAASGNSAQYVFVYENVSP